MLLVCLYNLNIMIINTVNYSTIAQYDTYYFQTYWKNTKNNKIKIKKFS